VIWSTADYHQKLKSRKKNIPLQCLDHTKTVEPPSALRLSVIIQSKIRVGESNLQ
jgi:hypothetical protein